VSSCCAWRRPQSSHRHPTTPRSDAIKSSAESSTIHTSSLNQPTKPQVNGHALVLARHRAGRGGLSRRRRTACGGVGSVMVAEALVRHLATDEGERRWRRVVNLFPLHAPSSSEPPSLYAEPNCNALGHNGDLRLGDRQSRPGRAPLRACW
jgi:hypothetical protein